MAKKSGHELEALVSKRPISELALWTTGHLEKSMIFNDEMDQTTVHLIFDLINDLIKSHQMEDQK